MRQKRNLFAEAKNRPGKWFHTGPRRFFDQPHIWRNLWGRRISTANNA
jgi:hypothetical protein